VSSRKRLSYTGFFGRLEDLKVKTRLREGLFIIKKCLFIIRGKTRVKENTYRWVSV
jgi:hypothetical protein